MIRVIARPNPFESELVYCDIEPGLSLAQIVGRINNKVHIQVEGVPIPQEAWESTYPVSGEVVTITVVPALFGLEAVLAAVMTAIVTMSPMQMVMLAATVASTVVAAVVKPQLPSSKSSGYSSKDGGRFSILNANSNPTMQYGVIPKLYGEFRFNPPLAGNAYSRIKNSVVIYPGISAPRAGAEPTQTYHLLLCLGYGPLKIGGKYIGPESVKVVESNGNQVSCVPLAGSNLENDCLNGDATAILVGNTPFRQVRGAKYLVGTASTIVQWAKNNDQARASYSKDIEETPLNVTLPTTDLPNPDSASVDTIHDGLYYIATTSKNPVSAELDIVYDALYATRVKKETDTPNLEDCDVAVRYHIYWKPSKTPSPPLLRVVHYDPQGNPDGYEVDLTNEVVAAWTYNGRRKSYAFETIGKVKRPCAYTFHVDLVDDPQFKDMGEGDTWDILIIRVNTYYDRGYIASSNCTANLNAVRSWGNTSNIWDIHPDTGLGEAILMAVEFQATNGLSGSIDAVSVKAKSVLQRPVADTRAGWASNQAMKWVASASPAWAFADLFLGPQLQEPFSVDRIDWPALIDWSNWCDGTTNTYIDSKGKTVKKITDYNWYHVEEETILDRARTIASCGRATWNISNGQFTVIQDTRFYPVQLFSPRNSRDLEITKSYQKIPNALRVRYVHPQTWQQDEVIVLDDYYLARKGNIWIDNWGVQRTPNQGGYKKARTFEVLETQGVTDKAQAKREGRYHIASMRLRPEVFTCTVDFENLVAQRGDCVLLSHDVLLRGWSFGRILKITPPETESGDYFIDVDTDFEITIGENFAIQVRSMNTDPLSSVPLDFVQIPVNNPPGKYTQFWVGQSQAAQIAKISVQDLFVFGPLNDAGNPTGSLLAKITQIDYQPDMGAKLTMVYAAPGIPAADDGLIDDEGAKPEPPPGVNPPPPPTSFRLSRDEDRFEMTPDGPRFAVFATWTLPITSEVIEGTEVHYKIGEGNWAVYQAKAGELEYSITRIPPSTQVWGKARCVNAAGASDFTEEATIFTPDESQFLPQMPTNLDLVQDDYREANGRIRYFIKVNWVVNGLTAGTEIQWIRFGDIEDPANWPDDNKLGKTFIDGGGQFFQIENVDVTMYKVRLRSKSIIPINGAYQYSAWNEGEIDILVYDYPPGPPTNLQAKSTPSGIMLTWDNPLDSDFAGIEIWQNIGNSRSGDNSTIPAMPPAELLTSIANPGNSFFHVPDDRIWHYYWIRAYDSEDGINPTNHSDWERVGNNDGVRGRQGTFGDGLPPPPPINLVLTPDSWQITLQWEQSQEILDLFGTQVYFSKTNDRGPDEALLATYLGETDRNFATHLGLDSGDTYYYWIRNIDVENLTSTWLPEDRYAGAAATVPLDPSKYLELLNGAITETQLAQSLLGLINTQSLGTNATFLALEKLVSDIEARVVLRLQQNYEGLSEVAAIGFGTEIQNEQIVSQMLVQADRFAMGAPQVFNSAGVELVPIQYDPNGNLPTVYDKDGNVITPCDRYGQPLPAHNPAAKGFIRLVYDADGHRMPIYGEDKKIFKTPRWDGFVVTTEEYIDENGKLIPPGVYIRNVNIAEGTIDGAKIKAKTITAEQIEVESLTLFDEEGNPIFAGGSTPVNLEALFGPEVAEAIRQLKDKNVHLYMKNGVIGDLFIADELSSVDYSASYFDESGQYVPGTGWRIHRGSIDGSVIGSPSIIETDNLEARGTLSSEIYVPGVQGWKVFKDGSCEFNNGVFRGTLGAETLLVGTDFTLKQLSEQVLLASLNINTSGQYFKFNSAGSNIGDVNITMFVNNIDNILWTATGYPGAVPLQLTEDETKPRYRFLNNEQIKKTGGYYDYIEVKAQFQDRYDILKVYPLVFESGIVTAELSNGRINLAADSSGYVGNYSLGTGRFRVHHGTTEVAKASLTFSVVGSTGCAVSIVSDPTKPNHGVYKVTDLTTATATATLRATYNGVNYDRTLDVLKYQAVLSGAPGEPGEDGTDGKRGSKFFVFYTYNPEGYDEGTWTELVQGTQENLVDAMVKTDPGSEGIVVLWDVVTLINYATGWSETRMRRDTGWEEVVAFFNGDIIVKGTIYADKIVSNSIVRMTSSTSYTSTIFAGGNQWQPQIGWVSPNPKYVVDAHPEMTNLLLVVTVTMDCPTDLTGVRIVYEQYGKDYWNPEDPPAWKTQYREIFNRGSAYYSARVFTATIVLGVQVPPGKAFDLYVEAKQLGTAWVNADANAPSLSVIETYLYYGPDDGWNFVF